MSRRMSFSAILDYRSFASIEKLQLPMCEEHALVSKFQLYLSLRECQRYLLNGEVVPDNPPPSLNNRRLGFGCLLLLVEMMG